MNHMNRCLRYLFSYFSALRFYGNQIVNFPLAADGTFNRNIFCLNCYRQQLFYVLLCFRMHGVHCTAFGPVIALNMPPINIGSALFVTQIISLRQQLDNNFGSI